MEDVYIELVIKPLEELKRNVIQSYCKNLAFSHDYYKLLMLIEKELEKKYAYLYEMRRDQSCCE